MKKYITKQKTIFAIALVILYFAIVTPPFHAYAQTPASPTPVPTTLSFDILLHGVGASGDNPNPNTSDLSNKNPLHPQRNFSLDIVDASNNTIKSLSGSLIYNAGNGSFQSTVDLGSTFPQGNYYLKLKSDRYLKKLVPGIINIKAGQDNNLPQVALIAGDINNDNFVNVLDYNILRDCGYGTINPLPLADPGSPYNSKDCVSHGGLKINTDLDDNGIIDSSDYNLFLREVSVQYGD